MGLPDAVRVALAAWLLGMGCVVVGNDDEGKTMTEKQPSAEALRLSGNMTRSVPGETVESHKCRIEENAREIDALRRKDKLQIETLQEWGKWQSDLAVRDARLLGAEKKRCAALEKSIHDLREWRSKWQHRALEAEDKSNALVEALERIRQDAGDNALSPHDFDRDSGFRFIHEIAYAALEQHRKGESDEQKTMFSPEDIKVDENLPHGVVEFRHPDGRVDRFLFEPKGESDEQNS